MRHPDGVHRQPLALSPWDATCFVIARSLAESEEPPKRRYVPPRALTSPPCPTPQETRER